MLADVLRMSGAVEVTVYLFGFHNNEIRANGRLKGRAGGFPVHGRLNSLLFLPQGALLPSFSYPFYPSPSHAGAGGARSPPMSDWISWNICRDTGTSAVWKVT